MEHKRGEEENGKTPDNRRARHSFPDALHTRTKGNKQKVLERLVSLSLLLTDYKRGGGNKGSVFRTVSPAVSHEILKENAWVRPLPSRWATAWSDASSTKWAAIFEGTPERVAQLSEAAVTAELLYVPCLASPVPLYETLQQGKVAFVLSLLRVGGASTTYSFSLASRTRLDTALLQPARWMFLNQVSW